MKRYNLADHTSVQTCKTEVLIVGSGIAGFVLAKQLSEKRISCTILESGGIVEDDHDAIFSDVDFVRRRYGGASEGRSRCLGGTSVKWGGALLPFRQRDFMHRLNLQLANWPIDLIDIEPFITNAERLFGLDHSSYDAVVPKLDTRNKAFVPREAKWPPFGNRNVTKLFSDIAEGRGSPEIWLNATVREFEIQGGSVKRVTAFGPQKEQQLTVTARNIVICAGAIETTRLMLLLDTQTEGQVIAGRAHLGKHLQDHLSLPLARIETKTPKKLNETFGFRWDGKIMRSIRLEQGLTGEVAGFVHVAPRAMGPTGFDPLREFMRSIQKRNPDLMAFIRVFPHGNYLLRMIWWRFFKKRLLWPDPAEYDVHFVIEQLSSATNKISLGDRTDLLGHFVAEIDWEVSESDTQELASFCRAFELFWNESGLSAYGSLIWTSDPEVDTHSKMEVADAIYHPVGTTRMAEDAENGVVDRNMKVFGLANLYLGATSVFPNGGSSNPTMTLILLLLRLAEHLEK